MSLFELKDVSYQYAAATQPALDRITLNVEEGALFALLGPNGSGKSTLLRVMLGELETSAGSVTYAGRPSASWGRREIATQIAFVPQAEPMAFPMTVRALVEMGRYPQSWVAWVQMTVSRSMVQWSVRVSQTWVAAASGTFQVENVRESASRVLWPRSRRSSCSMSRPRHSICTSRWRRSSSCVN